MTNPGALVEERQLLIGGKWVEASGGTYEIVNPATGAVSRPARPTRLTEDAEVAAAAARDALPGWAATPPTGTPRR